MKAFGTSLLAAAVLAAAAAHPVHASERADLVYKDFVEMCDTDKDGMVSKAEAMKAIGKMFDKHDRNKRGKLDKKQVEGFLHDLSKNGA